MGKSVRLGFVPNPFSVACHAAIVNGFLSTAGIDTQIFEFRNGSRAAEALDAGELDFAVGGHLQTMAAVQRGSDQVFIAPLAFEEPPDHLCIALLARPGGPRDACALEGHAVGVSAAGAISELQLRLFMRSAGAGYKNLRLIPMPFDQMARELGDGTVAAVSAVEPYVSQFLAQGIATVIDRGSLSNSVSSAGRVMITGLVARQSWIGEHRAETRAVAKAIGQGIDFVSGHEAEARTMIAAYTGTPHEAAARMTLPAFRHCIEASDLQRVIDLAVEHSMLTRGMRAEELIQSMSEPAQ
jgi:ABC-type nitrate/sulfonate/bicarbonate transport system substrate-binding protein